MPLNHIYLSLLILLFLPVVLNLCAPNLMGRGLKYSIIIAGVLILSLWFLFIFYGRTIQVINLKSDEKIRKLGE